MPDGTVIRNVPDNITQAELRRRYAGYSAAPDAQKPATLGATALDVGRNFGRAAVATARDAGQGMLEIAALPANAAIGAFNFATGGNQMNASQALDLTLDQAGIPKTENPLIRGINRAVGGVATGLGVGGLLSRVGGSTGAVGQALAAAPAQQLGGAVGGSTASQVAAEMGGGPVAQGLAGLAGGVIGGGLLRQGTVEGIKRSFRGGEAGRQNLQGNIRLFESVTGRAPSAGQGTQNRRMQAAESLLAKAPGGAGVMAIKGVALSDDLSAGIERQARKLSAAATPEQAGRMILKEISDDGGFVDKFKATQSGLYDKLDTYIPQDAQVNVSNTRTALAALNQEIKDAPELSKWFKNSRIQGIQGALDADTALPPTRQTVFADGVTKTIEVPSPPREWMPYESIKKLRTLVGNEMADASFASDVPRSKWKALYAALSRDLEAAATKAGPEAKQSWSRANTFTRAGMARLDSISHVLDKAGGPEKVYRAAITGTDDGATTLRAVMQSLPKEGQKTLSATVLRRMGRATAGVQDDTGSVFSTETFLTNWNKMSPQAKATLFDRYGPGFRTDMDKVAKVAANLRDGSKVFSNPSGTAQVAALATGVAGVVGTAAASQFGATAIILTGIAANNGAARMLNYPPFVKWLASTTTRPAGAIPASLNQLAQSKDPLLQEAAAALSAEYQGQQPAN